MRVLRQKDAGVAIVISATPVAVDWVKQAWNPTSAHGLILPRGHYKAGHYKTAIRHTPRNYFAPCIILNRPL